jgi:hypothetical protein
MKIIENKVSTSRKTKVMRENITCLYLQANCSSIHAEPGPLSLAVVAVVADVEQAAIVVVLKAVLAPIAACDIAALGSYY